jgi:hypothetical protein
MLEMEWKIMVFGEERKEGRRVGGKETRVIYLFYAPLLGQVRVRDSLWTGANAVIRGERIKHAKMNCGESDNPALCTALRYWTMYRI